MIALNHSKANAVYTGIALAADNTGANFLYAANFSKHRIDVYDGNRKRVEVKLKDADVPKSYSPFNIQNVNGKLYVMYAKVADDGEEEVGQGLGYVSVYNADGTLEKHFASSRQVECTVGRGSSANAFLDR